MNLDSQTIFFLFHMSALSQLSNLILLWARNSVLASRISLSPGYLPGTRALRQLYGGVTEHLRTFGQPCEWSKRLENFPPKKTGTMSHQIHSESLAHTIVTILLVPTRFTNSRKALLATKQFDPVTLCWSEMPTATSG